MIPKIIHYCWLSGDPYPELVSKCINSWKEIIPDYQFVLWDRTKINIEEIPWVKEAYGVRKYAFAADFIRFYALYNYGGIYLDADVEVLKSFDPILNNKYFLGEECGGDVEAAVVGAEAKLPWVKYCLDYYNGRHFIKEDGTYDTRPVPLLVNEAVLKYDLSVMPYQYFSPKNYHLGKVNIIEETYCVHHFDGKWVSHGWKFFLKKIFHICLYKVVGREGHNKIVKQIRKHV